MKRLFWCGAPLLASLALTMASPAAALPVSGTFSGYARVQATPVNPNPAKPASFYDGAYIQGTFNLVIPTEWGMEAPAAEIHFDLQGERFSFLAGPFEPDPGVISVAPALPGTLSQGLSFFTNYRPRFDGAIIDFYSDRGLMFQDDDFTTLAIGRDTVSSMGAYFADSRASIAVNVDVRSFAFDDPSAPIPEPPVWLLFGGGLAWLGTQRARQARATR